MENNAGKILKSLRNRWFGKEVFGYFLIGMGVGLFFFSVAELFFIDHFMYNLIIGISAAILMFVFLYRFKRPDKINEQMVARVIDNQYEQMENSTHLVLADNHLLPTLAILQKQKVCNQLIRSDAKLKVPDQIGFSLRILGICILLAVTLLLIRRYYDLSDTSVSGPLFSNPVRPSAAGIVIGDSIAMIENATVEIIPPQYLHLKSRKSDELDIMAHELSVVKWDFKFDPVVNNVDKVILRFHQGDSLRLTKQQDNIFTGRLDLNFQGFYQIETHVRGAVNLTDYYQIKLIRDLPPEIKVQNLELYNQVSIEQQDNFEILTEISDDHGIDSAYVIATVSQGSGESVKFREEKWRFDQQLHVAEKSIRAKKVINFGALAMEPGDELYFFIEAFDNKRPMQNHSRSETFFIALEDTTESVSVTGGGMTVDLMPDYFRSQRQIIIDTEKLVAERSKISKQEFNERSNALGYDQKLLRLRYGQYLGEEFESGIAIEEETEHEIEHEIEHEVDGEKEAGTKEMDEGHEHHDREQEGNTNTVDKLLETYVHAHDSEEEATFQFQSVKSKLRGALSVMWDAELNLRLYQPQKALPYEHKALKLLNEIRMHARIYVQRIGFEPPPLKPEETRLTGDLEEVISPFNKADKKDEVLYPYIRKSLALIEAAMVDQLPFTNEELEILKKAGNELAGEAINYPDKYLATLKTFKMVMDNADMGDKRNEALGLVRKAFWQILPTQQDRPVKNSDGFDPLSGTYIREIKKLNELE